MRQSETVSRGGGRFLLLHSQHCTTWLSRVRLFVTPQAAAHQAFLSVGFSRQEYWSGLPCPSIGDLPDPGTEPTSPVLADKFFTAKPPNTSEITLLREHHLSAVWG